ncbi:protein mms22 [Cladorrhinum sp. PSN332]|nr:protein mms22 [Cladorrhinum sp. PSN332]
MKNWRELGEVPDSENDDSSSDETNHNDPNEPDLPQPEAAGAAGAADAGQDAVDDIWNIPSSSPELARHHLTSSTRKQTPTKPSRPAPSPVQQLPVEEQAKGAEHGVEKDLLEDDISKRYVRDTNSQSPLSSLSSTPSLSGSPVLPRPSPSPTRERPSLSRVPSTPPRLSSSNPRVPSSPLQPASNALRIPSSPLQARGISPIAENNEESPRRTAVQLERSLRPRKPIQQHPYLLENAQYSTFMKSHGVKPIKVVQASQSTRKGEEEDSQEQEFQHEESQETPVLFDNSDIDELALSPSLPKTSPGRNLRTSSQRSNGGSNTDATSMSDGEDFPDLDRLKLLSVKKRSRPLHSLKRPGSTQQLSSARRKRPRVILDDSSPVREIPGRFIPTLLALSLPSSPLAREVSRDDLEAARRSPTRRLAKTPSPDFLDDGIGGSPVVIEDDQGGLSDVGSDSSGESSGSESEVVREQSRRIRGVLPASWLRLNQPVPKAPIRQSRQSLEPSPEPTIRKGVALPKPGTQKPPTSTAFLFDESEESDEPSGLQVASTTRPPSTAPPTTILIDDDASSGMEDHHVDWMLPGRKRQSSNLTSGRSKKQKNNATQSVFKGRTGQTLRQPKITSALSRSKSATTTTTSLTKGINKPRRSTTQSRRKRAATPPLLSILDVMESDAPKFIKIAARTAKKKETMGKSSPSRKVISLASRADNLDALSTLRDWKSGKTKPRVASELSKRPIQPKKRPALREVSRNVSSRPHLAHPRRKSDPAHPGEYLRQSNLEDFVLAGDENNELAEQSEAPPPPKPLRKKPVHDRGPWMRPAQLEEDEDEDKRRQLNARKRKLDAFYKRAQQALNLPTVDGPRARADVDFTLQSETPHQNRDQPPQSLEDSSTPAREERTVTKSRYRKTRRPRRVDPEAPQYARANDPLPADVFAVNAVDPKPDQPKDKLQGLGPYGTIYTQHFDVFPLDIGVFFHQSTVVGRGFIQKALESSFTERIRHQKASASWTSDEGVVFRWGVWDDKTSSELGILVDWIGEQTSNTEATTATLDARRAIEAADFILCYVLKSLSIPDDLGEKAFVARFLEVFSSFISRLDSLGWNNISSVETKTKRLEVAARFNVAMLAVRSISQAGSNPMETMKVEDVITRLCRATIKHLLGSGLDELRDLYGDLQQSSFRERGIRPDRVLVNCWVVVMRVLESVNIPRSSFWDVTQSVMLSDGVASSLDVQAFERHWQDMFTLLPLCEIDNSGILISGLRKTAPMEGWTLPQRLLKRVFELYQGNPRQPASFNEYCRALAARCHFLVQQWGWRKYTGIIGTIFDFFGSQNLANLRNEEVYKSPRFLEELGDGSRPSLLIESEDRCFHIFIKLLALAIQRLKELGRVNDIKNLVARTLPNHNRQYHKEDTIHQHDLAALRNHHDLLCTLFWVSPPDLRPAVHLIEKLVVPASAHKEACLISIRAWSQLARFVISNGEGVDVFRPFAVWRNNIFNQVLDQYLSAESDIEQQFRALAQDGFQGISKEMRDDMIAKNKASALDVLSLTVKTSLTVLQKAPNLKAAMYGLNTTQLQKVFTSLDFHAPKFDWNILSVALDTFGDFIDRVDQASEEQYSSEFLNNSQAVDSRTLEEAILMVNEQLARDFFWMSRTIMSLPSPDSLREQNLQTLCAEKTVTLAAKLASRFIKDRLTKLSSYFTPGKYCLFSAPPKDLATAERKYLALFLAVLLKKQIFDFRDIGTPLLGLWILSIVKPFPLLQYENYLAGILKHQNLPFIQSCSVPLTRPDHNTNHDFFLSTLQFMRQSLRSSTSSAARKSLREEYSSILTLAQSRIKADLSLYSAESAKYIPFIQQLISLLKSHGVNICAIDPFFLHPSTVYSPPMHDLALHAAGIVAYGVRLSEKDASAGPQLFWYLWNSFKLAFGNGKLKEEIRILTKAVRENKFVRGFVISKVLPSVLMAVAERSEGWLVLEVWVKVLGGVLRPKGVVAPLELGGGEEEEEEEVEGVGRTLEVIARWLVDKRLARTYEWSAVLMQTMRLVEVLRPHVMMRCCLDSSEHSEGIKKGAEVLERAFGALDGWIYGDDDDEEDVAIIDVSVSSVVSPEIQGFAKTIITDVSKNWRTTTMSGDDEEGKVYIKMARAAPSGAPVLGSESSRTTGSGEASVSFTRWDWDEAVELSRGVIERWRGSVGMREGVVEENKRRRRPDVMVRVTFTNGVGNKIIMMNRHQSSSRLFSIIMAPALCSHHPPSPICTAACVQHRRTSRKVNIRNHTHYSFSFSQGRLTPDDSTHSTTTITTLPDQPHSRAYNPANAGDLTKRTIGTDMITFHYNRAKK